MEPKFIKGRWYKRSEADNRWRGMGGYLWYVRAEKLDDGNNLCYNERIDCDGTYIKMDASCWGHGMVLVEDSEVSRYIGGVVNCYEIY